MENDGEYGYSFTRRALFMGALQCLLMGVMGARLGWLQIAQGPHYRTLAEDNRINLRLLAPSRGLILDRNDKPLAQNGQNFRLLIVPEQASDMEESLSRLQKLVHLGQRDIQRVLKQADRMPSFSTLEVRDNLDWDEVAAVEVNLPDLPGILIDEGDVRHYPLDHATAHLTGYVGAVSKTDIEKDKDPLLELPDFVIGKTGVEKAFDKQLRGSAGVAQMEVNVLGREVRELKRREGNPGGNIRLTIDADIQSFAYNRLKNLKSASAVLMNIGTGDVLALASFPGFDANIFSRGIPADLWEELLADPALPLNNKAAGGQYPPGSTFKMVTALAALEAGIINANTLSYCPGHYDFDQKNRFHCWKRGGHGTVNLIGALSQSCDVYFYRIAVELGIDRISACARKLGLGQKLGLGIPEERAGLVPTRDWKKTAFKDVWHPGESINASIGQGYTLTTPLQLAVMTARLANGGRIVNPRLIVSPADEQNEGESLGFKKKNLELVLRGMQAVMEPQGTAYAARIKDERFVMAGKTGTAQVKRITKQERAEGIKNEELAWRFRHHALFVGFAPVDKPRYSCCVVVEHGSSGAAAAAPAARDLLHKALLTDYGTVRS